jgi:hypothetical protein
MTMKSVCARIARLERIHSPELTTVIVTGGLAGRPPPSAEEIRDAQAAARAAGRSICVVGGLRRFAASRGSEWRDSS